jgi:PKD repeat protein
MSFRLWRHATGRPRANVPRLRLHPRRFSLSRPRSRGQALVELALILPVMLLMLAAALDLGRLFYSRITVNDAAREGALEAARNPTSFLANTACTAANKNTNRVMCRTLNEAKGGFVTVAPADVAVACSVTPCPTSPVLGDTVSVTVTGHFNLMTPLIGVFFGGQDVTFSSTASAQLNVTPATATPIAPIASFTASPTSGQVPLTVTFTDTSTGGPTSWAWDFGDGQTATTQDAVHTYTAVGSYLARLTVTNAGGSSSATTTITVTSAPTGAPVAIFTASPSSGSPPLTVTFTNASTGVPTSWAWNFGDGQSSNLQNPPPHVYANTGTFTVTLTVSNAGGSSTATQTVTTNAVCIAPNASFSVSPLSGKKKKASFVVTDSSSNMSNPGCNNTWSWNFGDGTGNSSLQAPPGHVYDSQGTYTIQLNVANSAGTSTASHVVTVTP